MKVDWKAVAQSPGYRSLKAAYIYDVTQRPEAARTKKERRAQFRWAIGRAMHYAHWSGLSVQEVLSLWEKKRDYWWVNFYQEHNLPKKPSGKPRNVKPQNPVTYYRRDFGFRNDPVRRFKRIRANRQREAHDARKAAGKKPRWSAERKARMARIRSYRQQNL